ncbi:hypothetical protein [Neisseria gonorrhoeae]|uniref:hypothetical protein n=1 Tax=Neisseria gonorrhoeae TaxID=485 RepID=UPI0018DF9E2F|nr:hypothetical protein [Neisseria gonorrhoeae]
MRSLICPASSAPAAADRAALSPLLPLPARLRMSQRACLFHLIGSFAVSVMRGLLRLPNISTPAPTGERRRSARMFRLGR